MLRIPRFGCVVVDAHATVIKIGSQPFEADEAIADGTGQVRFLGDLRELVMKPGFQIVDQRCRVFLPD